MISSDGKLSVPVARAFKPLLKPARYKGARGGRGAAKSHFAADQYVVKMATSHTRLACLREYQSSIKDSSKQLLEDKIKFHGVEHLFHITDAEIRGQFGSIAVFKGLQGNSAYSLKSLEGFTDAWVEEAHSISRRSIETMTPTFRRTPGMTRDPEMLFTWNSLSSKDAVEELFRQGGYPHWRDKDADDVGPPDERFACVTVSYRDNPWFPKDLRADMERDRARDPQKYAHVWLGDYRRLSEAAVFTNWTVREFESPPLHTADGRVRFYYGADWGFAHDPSVLVRCFIRGRTLFVDWEVSAVGSPFSVTDEERAAGVLPIHDLFKQVPGAHGRHRWPIRADSARPETIDHMIRHGFNISPAEKGQGSVEDGIEFLKSYDIVVHPRCKRTVDELAKYSWKIDKKTDEVLPVLEDKDNHVIDSLRYALEGERRAGHSVIMSPKQLQKVQMMAPRNRFTGAGIPARNRFARAM